MTTNRGPRYSKEEFARRGQEIYERDIRPQLTPADEGRFVAIDIETGRYEIDPDDYTASHRLRGESLDTQIWLVRVGQRATYRMSARALPGGCS
jgi:hypothetical protein